MSTFVEASKVPSPVEVISPTVAFAVVLSVRPPGLFTSKVTFLTSLPPSMVWSILETDTTLPSTCSPVSVSVNIPVIPGVILPASALKKGIRIFITLSL